MAAQVTKVCSPSKNWKKYWRYASSPTNYYPNTSIKVKSLSTQNLRINATPEFKQIDTGYVGCKVVCRNSPIIPGCRGFDARKKISKYRQALYQATQKPESKDNGETQGNTVKDPRLVSRKRQAETSPFSAAKDGGPKSHRDREPKVVKTQNSLCRQNDASRKRPLEGPSIVLNNHKVQSPIKHKAKILRLQEKYLADTPINKSALNDLKTASYKDIYSKNESGDGESCKTQNKATSSSVSPRQFPQRLEEFQKRATTDGLYNRNPYSSDRPNFNDWFNSLRPSLSEISLPEITPDNTMRLLSDDKGKAVVLGKGAYGFVTRGELGIGKEKLDCVLKTFRPSRSDRDMVFEEARILHYLANTRTVPKLFGVLETKDPSKLPAIVQECFAGGQDFYKLIDKHHTSKKDWVKICLNAAEGLCKIHAKSVLVNDIKPDNILVDDSNNIRFIDFGMATLEEGFFYPVGPEVEKCFQVAPECRQGEETTYRSDTFSFGIVLRSVGDEADVPELKELSKLLTCASPFQRINIFDTIRRLKELENVV